MMARTKRYTAEEIAAALIEFRGMVYLAAQKVGCHPDTIYERAKTNKVIHDAMNNERGKVVDTAELKLFQAVLAGESWAIMMVLKCLGRKRGYNDNELLKDMQAQIDDLRKLIQDHAANIRSTQKPVGTPSRN
jgi:hypothetical protein